VKISYPFNGVFNKDERIETFHLKSRAFFNLNEKEYVFEKEEFRKLGIEPALKGTSKFIELLQSRKSIKWAYTIYRELFIVPECFGKYEVPHSIAADGKPVFGAGLGQWEGDKLELNNWTGHYLVSRTSARLHLEDAWRDSGINFIVGFLLLGS
jgi:hypothetical protein